MLPIAVAGAGIGGLAAALALSKAGRRVTLYERSTLARETGAGLQLSPNACAALRGLGVLDDVAVDAVELEDLRIGRGRDGAVLARLPLAASPARFGAPFLVTRRADLHRVLRRRVAADPGIVLTLAARLTGWSATPAGLRLAFEGPAPGNGEAAALVGADGLGSAVRALLHRDGGAPRHRGTAWRATIDAGAVPPAFRAPASNLWMGRGLHLVHYPVAGGRLINVVAALDGPSPLADGAAGREAPPDPAAIAARFSAWTPPLRALIGAAGRWGTWPLVDREPLAAWSSGPVTLLGDAAHAMLPFLAQGAAQALEDAVALGRAVAAMPDDLAGAFRRYESQRRPRTKRVQDQSRRQAMIYHLPAPASLLRDMVLRATPPDKLLSRFDWLYAHSVGGDGARNDR